MMIKPPSGASLGQLLVFEFKDYEVSSGAVARDSQLSEDDSSTLTSIAGAVAKQGGNAARARSRSANRSSLRIAISPDDLRAQSKQFGRSESHSTTSTLNTLLASFATAAAATAFLRATRDMIIQWLQLRAERSLTFKHNGNTLVLKRQTDIEKLIAHLQRL